MNEVDVLVVGGGTAGAAAALAAARATTPLDLPLNEIRSLLRQHEAIVPEVD